MAHQHEVRAGTNHITSHLGKASTGFREENILQRRLLKQLKLQNRSLSPLSTLKRGYTIITDHQEKRLQASATTPI